MVNRILIIGAGMLLALTAVAHAQQGAPAAGDPPATQGRIAPNFVDANGDGICDNFQANQAGAKRGKASGPGDGKGQGAGPKNGTGYGPGDGTGTGVGPKDGTGYGPGAGARAGGGAGICDGTQKGRRTGRGRQ